MRLAVHCFGAGIFAYVALIIALIAHFGEGWTLSKDVGFWAAIICSQLWIVSAPLPQAT